MDGQFIQSMDGWTVHSIDGWMDSSFHRWMDGQFIRLSIMAGGIDAFMNYTIDGWRGGWIDVLYE